MKKMLLSTILLSFVLSSAFAEIVENKGVIIDNQTAATEKAKAGKLMPIPHTFWKTYTKEDALKPAAIESGYSIYIMGMLAKLDEESNAKIIEFLKQNDSTLLVIAVMESRGTFSTGKIKGLLYKLYSIKNLN